MVYMKLKYYLRGAGVALILAVLLTNVSHKNMVSAYEDDAEQMEEETEISVSEDGITLAEVSKKEIEDAECDVDSENIVLNTETVYEETQSIEGLGELDEDENVLLEDQDKIKPVDEQIVNENLETEFLAEEKLSEQNVVEEEQVQATTILSIEDGAQETFLLNIARGDDSATVSRKLYNAGLIQKASEFDAYLTQHGYDKKIKVGTVEVPIGATWLEIAEKLAGK